MTGKLLSFTMATNTSEWSPKNRAPTQMCLICPEVALDDFRHELFKKTAEVKRLKGSPSPTPTRKRRRPFRSSALPLCFCMI